MTPEQELIRAMEAVRNEMHGGIYSVSYTEALRELVRVIAVISSERAFSMDDVFGPAIEEMAKGN